MIRTGLLAAALTSGLLGSATAAGMASAEATARPWQTVDSYCSESGDVCYAIRAKGQRIQFRVDSFVDFGKAEICVKKVRTTTWVCRRVDLKQGDHEIFTARIRWQGNYPTNGDAKRIVRFNGGAAKLSFRP